MKTYLDVVEETVEYYQNNPFGYNKERENCEYYTKEGNMCAVGRCLKDPKSLMGVVTNGDIVIKDNMGGGLKDEYAHLNNPEFWQALQSYHDLRASGYTAKRDLKIVIEYAKELELKTKL